MVNSRQLPPPTLSTSRMDSFRKIGDAIRNASGFTHSPENRGSRTGPSKHAINNYTTESRNNAAKLRVAEYRADRNASHNMLIPASDAGPVAAPIKASDSATFTRRIANGLVQDNHGAIVYSSRAASIKARKAMRVYEAAIKARKAAIRACEDAIKTRMAAIKASKAIE